MPIPDLGRLERVELRRVWTRESGEFTPWLAQPENLKLLGDAIGLELELEAQEKDVGLFRADILCKDTANNSWVLIENQLEQTDHKHLGQLLTYAAGLKAVTIVWVASPIRDEHRAALDWLNSVTTEGINFFGLEIELWRIGTSAMAPKFNVVSQPNDWSKEITEGVSTIELSASKKLQVEFWVALREYAEKRGTKLRLSKPAPQNWLPISVGRTGFLLSAVASLYDSVADSYSGHELRAEITTSGPKSKVAYAALQGEKELIESELGQELAWYNPSNAKNCRIYLRRPADLTDRSRWPEYQKWLLDNLEAMYRIFTPRVKALNLQDDEGEEGLTGG